jgi:hypothetical protein
MQPRQSGGHGATYLSRVALTFTSLGRTLAILFTVKPSHLPATSIWSQRVRTRRRLLRWLFSSHNLSILSSTQATPLHRYTQFVQQIAVSGLLAIGTTIMSSRTKSARITPFSAAASQTAVEASDTSYPSGYVTSILLEISGFLVTLDRHTTLFGRLDHSPYIPSLRTLYVRLHDGQLNPSPLQSHANDTKRIKATIHQRTDKRAVQRPLQDYEDLYYAVLARMQDVHQMMDARLKSGFSALTDRVFADGPSVADMFLSLAEYWGALNETEFVKALDKAVRRSRAEYLQQEILTQVRTEEITRANADALLSNLFHPKEYDRIHGLAWISGWAPGMVNAWLVEKYRIVLQAEKEEAEGTACIERKASNISMRSQQPQQEPEPEKEVKKIVQWPPVQGTESPKPTMEHPQEQVRRGHRNVQEQIDYEMEWEMKAQRVSEYTQYLRSRASEEARQIVDRTVYETNMYMSGMGGPVQYAGRKMYEDGF